MKGYPTVGMIIVATVIYTLWNESYLTIDNKQVTCHSNVTFGVCCYFIVNRWINVMLN